MPPAPSRSDFDAAFMRLTLAEGIGSLTVGGSNAILDAANTDHGAFTSAGTASESQYNSTAMAVDDGDESEGDEADVGISIPCYYFLRITLAALDESDIEPCLYTKNDFQLVAWKSSAGHTKTRLIYGAFMQLVDPESDAGLIVSYLQNYIMEMQKRGHGLFLYVRIPDDDGQLEAIGDHMVDICALLEEYRGMFHNMDIAFTSLD